MPRKRLSRKDATGAFKFSAPGHLSDEIPITVYDASGSEQSIPFKGPMLKVQRARFHFDVLKAEIEAIFMKDPPTFRFIDMASGAETTNKLITGKTQIVMTSPSIPELLSLILGDLIHNLRASLDMMACELVRINNPGVEDIDDGVLFPFCETKDQLDAMIKRRKFHKAGHSAVELLRRYEPYHGGNSVLRAIHDLDVQDKHRSVIPANPTYKFRMITEQDQLFEPFSVVENIQFILTFPPGGPFGYEPLIESLHNFIEVTHRIIEAFAALAGHPLSGQAESGGEIINRGAIST